MPNTLIEVRWPVPTGAVTDAVPAGWLWERSWYLGPPPGATFHAMTREAADAMAKRVVGRDR